MKKFLLIALLCTPFISKAQVDVSFGPEVGFSWFTFTGKDLSSTSSGGIDPNIGLSYHLGGVAHVQIGNSFAIRPAVYFKQSTTIGFYDNLNFTDIEIPVDILFSKRTSKNHKIYFGAGPNIVYSIGGNVNDGWSVGRDLNFGDTPTDDFKPLGLGVNIKVGMQFDFGFGWSVYSNAGLGNRSVTPDITRWRNADLFGLNLSYTFGGGGGGNRRF